MADATTQVSTLQILIDIRARLDELTKGQDGFRKLREEAVSTGTMLKQGFGIDFARRAVDLFKEAVLGSVTASSQLAAEVQRGSRQVEISGEAYQVLAKKGGMAFDDLLVRLQRYRANLGQALLDPGKANVFASLGFDPQKMATMPLERQMELVSTALNQVSDANVRARMMQELFGRDAAAMVPLLEKLRVDGYDKLRDSARDAGLILDRNMSAALKQVARDTEEAKTRIVTALAPINLQFQQAKASTIGFFAGNIGPITSGIEAAGAAGIVGGIYKGLTKMSADGAAQTMFANFGKAMAGPFGVAFATAVGAFIIAELERRALEAGEKADAFNAKVHGVTSGLRGQLAGASSHYDVAEIRNRMQQEAMSARNQLSQLEKYGDPSDEQAASIRSLRQELNELDRMLAMEPKRLEEIIQKNIAATQSTDDLASANARMVQMEQAIQLTNSRSDLTPGEKRKTIIGAIGVELDALDIKIQQKHDSLKALGQTEKQIARDDDMMKLTGQRDQLEADRYRIAFPDSEAEQTRRSYETFRTGSDTNGSSLLSPVQGISAGFQQWSMSLGTIGQQISGTIGGALNNVSQGLVGLITKTQTWGQVGRSVGMLFLQTLVQIGMQELVVQGLQAAGIGLHVGGEATKTAATVAATSARSAANVAEAGTVSLTAGIASIFKSIMELGPIAGPLVFVAAVAGLFALVRSLSKGFSSGGYTGDGGRYEPAGTVHKGEVIFSQDDVARNGGVAAVEAMRFGRNLPGLGTGSAHGGGSSSSVPTVAGRPMLHVVYTDDAQLVARLRRRPDFEVAVTDVGKRRRGEIFSI